MVNYIYLLTFCCSSLFLGLITKRRIFKVMPFFLMTFYCGFRSLVGIDTIHYISMFGSIAKNIPVKVEIGYYLLVKFVQNIGGTQQLVFLAMSGATSFFIYKFIKKNSINFELSTLIYLCIGPYYFSSYNTVREALAVSIFLYSLRYIDSSLFKYFVFICGASLFHSSALVFIILPLVFKIMKKNSLRTLIIFTCIMLIVIKTGFIQFTINNFLPQYQHYISRHNQTMDFSYIVFLIICFFIILTKEKGWIMINEKNINLVIISFILIVIPLLTNEFTMIFTRMASYVTPILIIIIPYYANLIKPRWIYNLVMVFICITYFFVLLSTNLDMKCFEFNFKLFA